MTPFDPNIARTKQETEQQRPGRTIVALPVTAITATSAGTAQEILAVPDNRIFHVSSFKVCNHTGTAQTFTMHLVPSAGSAGNGNVIYSEESVPANDTVTLAERNTLMAPAGSTVEVHSDSATALNIILWGALIESGDPL